MKPIFLIMQNIGPFLNESVDFTKLDNMFLVSGKTGAGKTTIFDAMIYALYGEFSGMRKNKTKQFRSDFCSNTDHAFAEFTFALGGRTYRVHRTLPETYRNRNEKETTRLAEVSLETQENENWQTFNGGTTETNKKISDIIGLTAAEFEQIVVLPQGAFAEFLHEGSKERRDTLAKLFPVDQYRAIAARAKMESDAFAEEIRSITRQILELSQSYNPETTEADLKALDKKLAEQNKCKMKYTDALITLSAKKERIQTTYEAALTVEKRKKRKEELERQLPEINRLRNLSERAHEAVLLGEYIRNAKNAELFRIKLAEEQAETKKSRETAEKNCIELSVLQNAMEELSRNAEEQTLQAAALKTKLARIIRFTAATDKTVEAKRKRNEAVATLKKSTEKIIKLQEQLTQTVNEAGVSGVAKIQEEKNQPQELFKQLLIEKQNAAAELERKRQNVQKAEEKQKLLDSINTTAELIDKTARNLSETLSQQKNTQACLDDYLMQQKADERNNTACILVESLIPGEPCPVCGSKEHPSPAEPQPQKIDLATKIETQQKNLKLVNDKFTTLAKTKAVQENTLSQLQERQKEIDYNLTIAQAQEKSAAAENYYLKINSAYETAERIIQELNERQEELHILNEKYSTATSDMAAAEAAENSIKEEILEGSGMSESEIPTDKELTEQIRNLQNKVTENTEKYKKWTLDLQSAEKDKAASDAKYQTLTEKLCSADDELRKSNEIVVEKLKKSSFNTVEETEQAMLPSFEIEKIEKQVTAWQTEITTLEAQLVDSTELGTSSDIQTELHKIEQDTTETETSLHELEREIRTEEGERTTLSDILQRNKELEKKRKTLLKKSAAYTKLASDLNGNNPKKIPFDAWVLGMYFDEIVSYANTRFHDISNGRYNFKIAMEIAGGNSYRGLDLLVTDSYTGTDRDTAMLSGGETFMASISLALALTDVVQARSGGIRLDSLFIDEGFGSLDSESLDNAISILNRLQESRMVGVISHVESMRSAIPSCIEVTKSVTGSRIRIRNEILG